MGFVTSPALQETGFVVLDRFDQQADPAEWLDLDYVDGFAPGTSRIAPLTSFAGELEGAGFWSRTPPRPDRDGVPVRAQTTKAPRLLQRATEPGAATGRSRVIEIPPNDYPDAVCRLHQDDNNRLVATGEGWIVRSYFSLSDDPDSLFLLREDLFDPDSEVRIPLHAGTRIIVDTQRCWHAIWHRGTTPHYALMASWTSGPALDGYIAAHHGTAHPHSVALERRVVDDAEDEHHRRVEERRRDFEAQGIQMEPPIPLDH